MGNEVTKKDDGGSWWDALGDVGDAFGTVAGGAVDVFDFLTGGTPAPAAPESHDGGPLPALGRVTQSVLGASDLAGLITPGAGPTLDLTMPPLTETLDSPMCDADDLERLGAANLGPEGETAMAAATAKDVPPSMLDYVYDVKLAQEVHGAPTPGPEPIDPADVCEEVSHGSSLGGLLGSGLGVAGMVMSAKDMWTDGAAGNGGAVVGDVATLATGAGALAGTLPAPIAAAVSLVTGGEKINEANGLFGWDPETGRNRTGWAMAEAEGEEVANDVSSGLGGGWAADAIGDAAGAGAAGLKDVEVISQDAEQGTLGVGAWIGHEFEGFLRDGFDGL